MPDRPPRPRGAPRGNLNAVKHGRNTRAVRETRALLKSLETSLADAPDAGPTPIPAHYVRALNWSLDDQAVLQIAVIKRAAIIRWRLEIVAALEAGKPLPAPPSVLLTRRESALYAIYVQQRRLLRNSVTWDPSIELDQQVGHNAVVAYHELRDWRLASDILPRQALAALDIDVEATLRQLNDRAVKASWYSLQAEADSRDMRVQLEAEVFPLDFTWTTKQIAAEYKDLRRVASAKAKTIEQQNKRTSPTASYDA
ncbi:MAG: hypothetical protein WEB00_07115 [Dehalococcoidia bacterium]